MTCSPDELAAIWLAVALQLPPRAIAALLQRWSASGAAPEWSDIERLDASRQEEGPPIRQRVQHVIARGQSAGLSLITWNSSAYPALLRQIADPPVALWVAGESATLSTPCVAVVGARRASHGALEVARRLARDLASRGLTVVSGLAVGVDAAAHEGALSGGRTAAVLGTGADRIYPACHAALARQLTVAGGALASEFPPGTPPRRHHFPLRNRIVSGLSLGVVVVEAGETSGALITARAALDQGREVMVVPGAALAGRNRGGHKLVKDGAALVEDVRDVLEVLCSSRIWQGSAVLPMGNPAPAIDSAAPDNPPGRDELQACRVPMPRAWGAGDELDLSDLQALTCAGPGPLLAALLEWELAGWIARTPDGRFVRCGRKW